MLNYKDLLLILKHFAEHFRFTYLNMYQTLQCVSLLLLSRYNYIHIF